MSTPLAERTSRETTSGRIVHWVCGICYPPPYPYTNGFVYGVCGEKVRGLPAHNNDYQCVMCREVLIDHITGHKRSP